MPLIRFPTPAGLVYTIDLSKIADRANPRTVEAPIYSQIQEQTVIDWGDGTSTTIQTTDAAYPTHQYAADGVYTVVIRSATGHLPLVSFNNSYTVADGNNPQHSITKAVVSCDHFAGWLGGDSPTSRAGMFNGCSNMAYCDTRIAGLSRWNALPQTFQLCSALDQPIESFCFSFCVANANSTFSYTFSSCRALKGTIPTDMFDGLVGIKTFGACFNQCDRLTPPPYIFWKEDGALDTGKFPNLANAANCYANCSAELRAQVPTTYGGTMTVS